MSGKISYKLSDEFIQILESEFSISKMINAYKETIKEPANPDLADVNAKHFGTWGRTLAEKVCRLESQYRDRNAEVVHMIAEKTGHAFPSIQQRLIEIAYIALMNENQMKFQEISFKRLAYGISKCVMHKTLMESLGEETVNQLPCSHFCLELFNGVCDNTDMKGLVHVHMEEKMGEGTSRCLFSAHLTLEEQIRLEA